jgi:hypothetical protein
VCNLHLDWPDRRNKLRSYRDTRLVSEDFARHVPLQTKLDTLSKKDFRAYRDVLWERVDKKNRRRSSANRPIRILRAAFRKAYRESDHMVNGEAVYAYLYDALGRWIGKIVDADGASPQTTYYFYAGDRAIEERNAAGSTTATYVSGRYLDEVLTARRDVDGNGTAEDYFFHADDLYNVTVVTDATG